MNNEIGRKITSLTLMTIMVAGGMTFAAPGFMPAAHAANANLFVSAENSQFDNYMAGAMVIEVVVIDSDISDTNEGKGEPDVTVQGKSLRMAQATDGNWYGYFANLQSAEAADATQDRNSGKGLDFGFGCDAASATLIAGVTLSQTKGVYFPRVLTTATGGPGTLATDCAGPTSAIESHVIRENKTLNFNSGLIPNGQIGVADFTWPFIQLFDLNPTGSVNINYNKGGGTQSTTLTFDTVDQYANLESDRTIFPTGAQIHLTMTDLQLNIDPTDEDSWTWQTLSTNSTTFYQLFNEDGGQDADGTIGAVDISPLQTNDFFMFDDNGFLFMDVDAQSSGTDVIRIVNNDDSNTNGTTTVDASSVSTCGTTGICTVDGTTGLTNGTIQINQTPVTFTELIPNSGIFTNYDNSDVSNLAINTDAPRGKSATIDYNDTPKTVLVGLSFATIDLFPVDDEWNSGEVMPIVLVDNDANLNSRVDEDLDLNNPDVPLIPALATGTPFTLGVAGVECGTSCEQVAL